MENVTIIGELMNNSYARARRAWEARKLEGFQQLACIQTDLGADYLTLNIDGTRNLTVKPQEMLEFLPELVPAIQETTTVPISFDNPWIDFHIEALKHYDRSRSPAPILNSLAASRDRLDEMIELVAEYDTLVFIMASEKFLPDGASAQCLNAQDGYDTTKHFVEMLVTKAGRRLDQIIVDTGLTPVSADTYGMVNLGLDTMRLIQADPDLEGIHLSVGLSNFAWGTPKAVRLLLERAYLNLGLEVGLDFALANPEKTLEPLDPGHPMVGKLRQTLELGRIREGESQEDAGYRQVEGILKICSEGDYDG